jgi:hypothetical protein
VKTNGTGASHWGTRSEGDVGTRHGDASRVRRTALAAACALTLGASVANAQTAPGTPTQDASAPAPAVPPAPAPDTTTAASPLVADALPPPPNTPRPPTPEPVFDGPDPTRFAVGAGGHIAFGSAPAVAVGAQLSAELTTVRWSFGLEGRYDAPASARTTQGATARTSLAGIALLPCVRAKATFACAVVLLSHVEADAAERGGSAVNDGFFFLGIGGRIALHAAMPWEFALRIGGEVLAHPIPYELSKDGTVLFRSSAVSTSIGPALVRAF